MRQPEPSSSSLALRLLTGLVVLSALLSRRRVAPSRPGAGAEQVLEGFERKDMNPTVVLAAAGGLLLTLAVVLVAITAFEAALTGVPASISRPTDLIGGLQAAPAPTPPAPRLEEESGQTLDAYRAAEAEKLNGYRWVDRQAGVASMPIDRAMDLVAQRGLPARATPPPARDDGTSSPSRASSGRVEEAAP